MLSSTYRHTLALESYFAQLRFLALKLSSKGSQTDLEDTFYKKNI